MGRDAPPTVEQLRDEIDSGATREKVAYRDPAAAPLGADAEAGGSPSRATERRMEARARQPLQRAPRETRGALERNLAFVAVGVLALTALALTLG